MIHLATTGTIPRPLSRTALSRAVRLTFEAARRAPSGAVSVGFVTDRKMQSLNRTWRKMNKSTDVLSFSPAELPKPVNGREKDWGDLFVSPSYVRREAKKRGIPFSEELLRVTIHGVLHLFGYDHATASEEKRMFGIQERVLRRITTV